MTTLADRIERALVPLGTTERATKEKAYLKSELVHLGVPMPTMRRAVVGIAREIRAELTHDALIRTVEALWRRGVFELRAAAVELLIRRGDLLDRADVPLIERLIRESKTWALVDAIAPAVMGGLIGAEPALARTLDRWAADDDFWVRRAAMLALLLPLRRGEGDFARFGRYADAMLDEKEFFIRKAIGWILRETSKREPALVFAWLEPRAHRASGVTMREAVKYLPASQREALARAAAREPMPARRPAESGPAQKPASATGSARAAKRSIAPPKRRR
jgi:3-methyladenine DNA glycosylase AlkD